jgi:phosphoribosylaminoimidazole-succinocarboxamide synthase
MKQPQPLLGDLLHGGKTKTVFDAGTSMTGIPSVIIYTKDDITVGYGTERFIIPHLGEIRSAISANCFGLLEKHGIKTHFLGHCKGTAATFAKKVIPIPFEVVFRFLADGSYLKRNPEVRAGTEFREPIVEFFFKSDLEHDPFVVFSRNFRMLSLYRPKEPVTLKSLIRRCTLVRACPAWESSNVPAEYFHKMLTQITIKAACVLREAFKKENLVLVDGKFEFGVTQGGVLLLSDSIDPDSLRLFVGQFGGLRLDKEFLRKILAGGLRPQETDFAQLRQNYQFVENKTRRFLLK